MFKLGFQPPVILRDFRSTRSTAVTSRKNINHEENVPHCQFKAIRTRLTDIHIIQYYKLRRNVN